MSIVNWGTESVTITHEIDDEDGQAILMHLLKYDAPIERWEGKTVFGSKTKNREPDKCRVELRKTIGDSKVLIRVGHVEEHVPTRWGAVVRERDVTIGTSGKMHFLPEEIVEMTLAISEARNVLDNHLKSLDNK